MRERRNKHTGQSFAYLANWRNFGHVFADIRMEIWWWMCMFVCVCFFWCCERLLEWWCESLGKGDILHFVFLSMFYFDLIDWLIDWFFFFWFDDSIRIQKMEIWSCIVYSNNRAYSPKEQLGDVCSWSFCCICCWGCCSDDDCCDNCVVSMFDGDRNSECAWLCGCCGCWNWKCCCDVSRSMWSVPVSMLWYWLLWFGLILRLAASRLLRDCFDGSSQLSNILIDVDGSSNRNNPFVTQLPVKCCAVWFAWFVSGCDWLCWLFWDCFATASKIVAIYNIRGQTGLTNRFDFQTTIFFSSSSIRFCLIHSFTLSLEWVCVLWVIVCLFVWMCVCVLWHKYRDVCRSNRKSAQLEFALASFAIFFLLLLMIVVVVVFYFY